jgi:hypothetical protein
MNWIELAQDRTQGCYFLFVRVFVIRMCFIFFVCVCLGLDDRGSRVRFPAGAGNFSLHHRVQNGSGTHPSSYPMGTSGTFPEGKAAGA